MAINKCKQTYAAVRARFILNRFLDSLCYDGTWELQLVLAHQRLAHHGLKPLQTNLSVILCVKCYRPLPFKPSHHEGTVTYIS